MRERDEEEEEEEEEGRERTKKMSHDHNSTRKKEGRITKDQLREKFLQFRRNE